MSDNLKDIYRENWEKFRDAAKQEKENLKDSINYTVEDINNGEFSAGGCLKKVLIWGLIIILFFAIVKSCRKDKETSVENNTQTQSADNVKTNNNPHNEEQSNDDFYFLAQQIKYAKQNGIELNNFPKERKALLKNMNALGEDFCSVSTDNILGAARYKATVDDSKYKYAGAKKDNYPDGVGMLLKKSDVNLDSAGGTYGALEIDGVYYNLVYIGNFSEGRFDGYGLRYNEPEVEECYLLDKLCGNKVSDDTIKEYYCGWLNYIDYDGMFKKGEFDGQGNSYYAYLEKHIYSAGSIDKIKLNDPQYDAVIVSEFKNGEENGKSKMYACGKLIYDCEMKNGQKDGYGCSYYSNGNLEYKGNYKLGKKHGKGTLYNSDGSVVYDGEWNYGDYK